MDLALIFELLIDDPKSLAAAVLLRDEGLRLVEEIAALIGLEPKNAQTTAMEVERLCGRFLPPATPSDLIRMLEPSRPSGRSTPAASRPLPSTSAARWRPCCPRMPPATAAAAVRSMRKRRRPRRRSRRS